MRHECKGIDNVLVVVLFRSKFGIIFMAKLRPIIRLIKSDKTAS